MSDDKSVVLFSELESSAYLLKRLDKDIKAIYSQMAFLEIAFSNLKDSWLAIGLAHKVVKDDAIEEN